MIFMLMSAVISPKLNARYNYLFFICNYSLLKSFSTTTWKD